MRQEELKEIIERHKHWIKEDCEGWENLRADLSGANLSGAYLSDANLSGADLRSANLIGANLSDADLSEADLRRANLSGADLRRADLRRANLSGADLSEADISEADIREADLRRADLRSANLSEADIREANLSGVKYDTTTAFFAMTCPEEGSFIGWKKVRANEDRYIIKLRIPADAKRSSATSRKCRCSHAEVLEIQNRDGSKADVDSVVNESYTSTTYTVGETVHADEWDEDRWNECSHGIHFFITRDEAVNY